MPRRSALALEVVTKLILLVVIERSTPILAFPLMELLAIRLGWQKTPAKSLVMQGGRDMLFYDFNHALKANHSLYRGVSETRSFSTWQPLATTSFNVAW
jgi:hypothetical protein